MVCSRRVALCVVVATVVALVPLQAITEDQAVLERLHLRPGMRVADIGAGGGRLALLMAGRVGAEGRVFANEIAQDRIDGIERLRAERGAWNLTAVLGNEVDPKLPDRVDVIVLRFVYHHLSRPAEFMRNVRRYLAPGGRLYVVAEDIVRAREDDPTGRRHQDACVSDPVATAEAIERAGFVREGTDHLDEADRLDYILTFRLTPDRAECVATAPFRRRLVREGRSVGPDDAVAPCSGADCSAIVQSSLAPCLGPAAHAR